MTGLVGFWDLRPRGDILKAYDLSGKNYEALLVNGPVWTDQGIQLDGSNDYIDTQVERMGSMGLFAGPSEAWTVMVAARRTSNGTLLARASATESARTFHLLSFATPNRWGTFLRGTLTDISDADSNWHVHFVRWNGSVAQYRGDAGGWTTLNVGSAVEETGQRIILGARTNGTGFFMPGDHALTLFYDRALTDAEADTVYGAVRDRLFNRGVSLP